MLAVVLLIAFVYMASKMVKRGVDDEVIYGLIKQTYKYSGINDVLYREFLANINMALEFKEHEEISRKLLDRATGNLEELALYMVSSDTSISEEIETLLLKITIEFDNIYRRT